MYACGGCADVGEVADQACRKLRREGFAQASMSCITGIAARMQPFIDAAKKANQVVVIDGCPVGL
ncbi:putative zinc-binding protein [Sporomusa acidovorans]|uniref:DGC domain protein n=1 Tax=Sporomusa acidovorans (strain ATCC 49682 / DSM 3132 / Mol) TaxID=1123286 RepID=A0ABZ3IYY7_SPOA4|nr:putative zinc-binding protein [Sporomusa acidovorans]OZC14123.1 DGC domain protein [Sporomusa acidovorans DSM 3132]SDE68981.1 DGC domain-containing protein [Sporomusa acidovorans]